MTKSKAFTRQKTYRICWGEEVIDGQGAYAIPGLIDLHFHGCMGDDFCDNSKEAIENIAKYEASVGVTTIAPATMTLPVEETGRYLKNSSRIQKEQESEGSGSCRREYGRPVHQPGEKRSAG